MTAPRALVSIFTDADGWCELLGGGLLSLGLSLSEWTVLALGVTLIFAVSRINVAHGGRARDRLLKNPFAVTACIAFLVLSTLVFGSYGIGFEESSFIYSQF
jgi:hypothetical protein